MEIKRCGSEPSTKGPDDYFTGTVRVDPLFIEAEAPSRLTTAIVTFEPKARTAWHVHPLEQTIVILSECGRAQREGGPVEEIRTGDAVRFASNERHWHGASETTTMSHVAIQEKIDGSAVAWQDKVTDEQVKS